MKRFVLAMAALFVATTVVAKEVKSPPLNELRAELIR